MIEETQYDYECSDIKDTDIVPSFNLQRQIIKTEQFIKDCEKLDKSIEEKIREIIKNLRTFSQSDFLRYLQSLKTRKFHGIKWGSVFKFRLSRAHRIIFVYGNFIKYNKIDNGSIILLRYVADHDMQEKLAEKSSKNLSFDKLVFEETIKTIRYSFDEKRKFIAPLYTENNYSILSSQAQETIKWLKEEKFHH